MYFLDPNHIPSDRPRRIVSLVPSQTELLYHLGLQEETVGITKFCIHPESWFRTKTRTGGTKSIHVEKIRALEPDLIIANQEENVKEQIEALNDTAPVWVSDIHNLYDALRMIRDVGTLTGRAETAERIAATIEQDFAQLARPAITYTALYLIWRRPWMTIGNDTFIHDMMQRCGLANVYGHKERYPEVSAEEIAAINPALILLSSEPYPFREKHIAELQELAPGARIMLVDGELFSWYGSRLLQSVAYFNQLLAEL
jgi:ABC-type Fe3+-hydroxamate transport system substrate-binding protein